MLLFFVVSTSFCLLLKYFGLVLEYGKSKIFYFSRLHKYSNFPSLNLSCLGGPVLCPKDNWRYLRFIFNRKLSFWQHIKLYSNKVLLIVKYMKMLENSMRELIPHQKKFYTRHVSFLLCCMNFYYGTSTKLLYCTHSKNSKNTTKSSSLDLSCFSYFSFLGIKTIAGLISIYLHLQKLSGKH